MTQNDTQITLKEKLLKMTNKLSLIEDDILNVKLQIKILEDDFLKRCRDNYTMSAMCAMSLGEIDKNTYEKKKNELESKLEQLETKRQHILDRRNGWLSRLFFSGIIPVVVTLFTAYVLNVFGLLK